MNTEDHWKSLTLTAALSSVVRGAHRTNTSIGWEVGVNPPLRRAELERTSDNDGAQGLL